MIKGAKELLHKASKPIEDITKNIDDLEAEKKRLIDSLDTSDNQFNMNVVKKNKAIEADIHLISNTLNRAKKYKEELLLSNASEVYTESTRLINEYRKEVNEKHKKDNQRIVDVIDEVRETYKSFKEYDKQYSNEVSEFVEAVKPYLDPRKKIEFGAIETQERQLEMITERFNAQTRLTLLDIVRDDFFNVDGLISEFNETQMSKIEREKYLD